LDFLTSLYPLKAAATAAEVVPDIAFISAIARAYSFPK
jgi:hypothetical protein